jgi:hypothetical protein
MLGNGIRGNFFPHVKDLPRVRGAGSMRCPLAFICLRVKGLVMTGIWLLGAAAAAAAFPSPVQTWSAMAAISISSPQVEHLIEGRVLTGRAPLLARVVVRDISTN